MGLLFVYDKDTKFERGNLFRKAVTEKKTNTL